MIKNIDKALSPDTLKQVEQTRDKRASSWLNAISYEEQGFSQDLNKQEFKVQGPSKVQYALEESPPEMCMCAKLLS